MFYKAIIRPLLFLLDAETAHRLTMGYMRSLGKISFVSAFTRMVFRPGRKNPESAVEAFGLKFPHPIGLAAGLDKDGDCYNQLSDYGFAFVEIGSLTPKKQEGNKKPRLFRLREDRAIINRMGINNKGVLHAAHKLRRDPPRVIVAASIAKNSDSDEEMAVKDYVKAFCTLQELVDFVVVNVSCPNVDGLTALQDISYLSEIMDEILEARTWMDKCKPVLVKLSPDIPKSELDAIIKYALQVGIDGIVAGNTSRKRENLSSSPSKVSRIGAGGLSGAPIFEKSLAMVRYIHEKSEGKLPIIGVGGVMSAAQAQAMLDAGASLVELYTGFIFEGPSIVKKILKGLRSPISSLLESSGPATISKTAADKKPGVSETKL